MIEWQTSHRPDLGATEYWFSLPVDDTERFLVQIVDYHKRHWVLIIINGFGRTVGHESYEGDRYKLATESSMKALALAKLEPLLQARIDATQVALNKIKNTP